MAMDGGLGLDPRMKRCPSRREEKGPLQSILNCKNIKQYQTCKSVSHSKGFTSPNHLSIHCKVTWWPMIEVRHELLAAISGSIGASFVSFNLPRASAANQETRLIDEIIICGPLSSTSQPSPILCCGVLWYRHKRRQKWMTSTSQPSKLCKTGTLHTASDHME